MARMLINLFGTKLKNMRSYWENTRLIAVIKKVLAEAVENYNEDYFRHPFRSYITRIAMYAEQVPKKRDYAVARPPFPLLDIYYNIVYEL